MNFNTEELKDLCKKQKPFYNAIYSHILDVVEKTEPPKYDEDLFGDADVLYAQLRMLIPMLSGFGPYMQIEGLVASAIFLFEAGRRYERETQSVSQLEDLFKEK